MFAPVQMPAPSPTTYPAPAYVPRQPAMQAAAPSQPKPLIRAQAPEEPNPVRPPLLTLPSPEQLGVSVQPLENATDWTAIHSRMKELGVVSFHMDSLPDGRSRFTCWMPSARPGLNRRIESVASTEAEAVQSGLREAASAKR
ncbi:MAG: hypothetical protein ACYC3I_02540 [Gemmataceae bacterium]